ncbi:MAG: hypothetical protein ACRYFU_13675 [Janthinobacterium lividum]
MKRLHLENPEHCSALISQSRRRAGLLIALLFLAGLLQRAQASVAVLLGSPYGKVSILNPTGHSALYFDHICAESPILLRPCAPGELGVVISRYDGVGSFDWIAIPLLPYLYAVDETATIPSTADGLTVLRGRDVYRREHLEIVAPDTADSGMPLGNWYQLVGAAYNRTLYGFRVKTTADQDARMIALFNDAPNVSRYSGAFRNCADFVRVSIDRLYPHCHSPPLHRRFGHHCPEVSRARVDPLCPQAP